MSCLSRLVVAHIATAEEAVAGGVEYNRRDGAACPVCGQRLYVQTTRPWDGSTRIRYHRCRNRRCVVSVLGPVKSIETE